MAIEDALGPNLIEVINEKMQESGEAFMGTLENVTREERLFASHGYGHGYLDGVSAQIASTDRDKLRQAIGDYLTAQYVAAPDGLPADESLDEADVVIDMVLKAING